MSARSMRYFLRPNTYNVIKNNIIDPLINNKIAKCNDKCCATPRTRRVDTNAIINADQNNESKVKIINRVIRTKNKRKYFFCEINENSITYYDWLEVEQLNKRQQNLLIHPKELKAKINKFKQDLKSMAFKAICQAKSDCAFISVPLHEEVYRKCFESKIKHLFTKGVKHIKLDSKLFDEIFGICLNNIRFETKLGQRSNKFVDNYIHLFRPTFRYIKNRKNLLVLNSGTKEVFNMINYLKFKIKLKTENIVTNQD